MTPQCSLNNFECVLGSSEMTFPSSVNFPAVCGSKSTLSLLCVPSLSQALVLLSLSLSLSYSGSHTPSVVQILPLSLSLYQIQALYCTHYYISLSLSLSLSLTYPNTLSLSLCKAHFLLFLGPLLSLGPSLSHTHFSIRL